MAVVGSSIVAVEKQVTRDGNESLHLRIPRHEDSRGSMPLDISDEDADRRSREHPEAKFTTTELTYDESMDVRSESATDDESMDATVESAADDVESMDVTSGSMNITTAASFNVSVSFQDRSALEESSLADASLSANVTDEGPTTYEIVPGGTAKGKDMLIDSLGYSYNVRKLNPGIEAPLTRMLDQIQGVLDRQQDGPDNDTAISLVFREDENVTGVMLKISSHLSGLPFSWNFQCKPADKALTSDHLTMPLMTMVGELTRRQQELIKIIETKDKEIDDYKSQGAKTTRKHIETVPFVETAFEMNMMTSKGFKDQVQDFGLSTFDAKGQDLYRQIMCKRAWINRSPGKDSGDDESLLDDMSTQGGRKRSADSSWGNSRLPPSLVGSRSPTKLASQSPTKSPTKSPRLSGSEASPVKDSELLRRQALERRLEVEENKKMEKTKKKKKIAF